MADVFRKIMLNQILFYLIAYFKCLPTRFKRLGRHFWRMTGVFKLKNLNNKRNSSFFHYFYELFILGVEISGIAEFYELIHLIFKKNTRHLTSHEKQEAQLIFGESLRYDRILIDDKAAIACKKGHFAYVSFYIINHWGSLEDSHFIHELAHIWQYEQLGARYMLRAILAQQSAAGYNYGGISTLKTYEAAGKNDLIYFNLEQQAEIITDYYRLLTGKRPQYGDATAADIAVYARFSSRITKLAPLK